MPVRNSPLLLVVPLLALLVASNASLAAELYKYVNEDGVTVLDSHVPPQFVKNGYTVLSSDGRVIEVVPRAPTAEEIAAEKRRRDREAADAALMRLYGSPEDVERARDTKLGSLQGFVAAAETTLARLIDQKREAEGEVAKLERAGNKIPQDNLDRIKGIQSRIEQTQAEIRTKTAEIDDLARQYKQDLERVTKLYEQKDASS